MDRVQADGVQGEIRTGGGEDQESVEPGGQGTGHVDAVQTFHEDIQEDGIVILGCHPVQKGRPIGEFVDGAGKMMVGGQSLDQITELDPVQRLVVANGDAHNGNLLLNSF